MLRIGLTGGIGSGKSTVAQLFGELGAAIIDTDVIAHQLTAARGSALPALQATFSKDYFHTDGTLKRAAMRELIFSDAHAKQQLEAILHPLIFSQAQTLYQQALPAPYCLIVVPLLLQSPDFLHWVQRIVLVDCAEAQQIERVMRRSQLSAAQVRTIIAQQTSHAELLAAADDIIANQHDLGQLAAQVHRLHEHYVAKSSLKTE